MNTPHAETDAAMVERARCCRIVYGLAGSDNAAQRIVEAIKGGADEFGNFCGRCGKRSPGIHTCSPPSDL